MDITLGLGAYGLMAVGLTLNATGGGAIQGTVGGESWSMGVEFRALAPGMIATREPIDPTQPTIPAYINVFDFSAVLAPCYKWKYLSGCAAVKAGLLYFWDDTQAQMAPTFSLGPRLKFEYPFADRFAVFALAEALFVPLQNRIALEASADPTKRRNGVWVQSPVEGNFGAGLAVYFK